MTLVIAHRGACWELPENTLAAFERAIEVGADFVEFDVHATSDGTLVVCHDRPLGGELHLVEAVEALAGRIGVMCELKSPWRYRRHDVVGRSVALLPEDAVVLSFDARALQAVRVGACSSTWASAFRSRGLPATPGAWASTTAA